MAALLRCARRVFLPQVINRRVEDVMEGADHLVASPLTPALLSLCVIAYICESVNYVDFISVWGCNILRQDR